ncbi:hypothetical protein DICVIV_12155 [Dictyocaulus viviparus]|uniref:ZP domain-containing protein n=1 Tax=Dictyocaulus viviparus TaxID=29172 RepID=A0A0D8XHP8_DICVI|nr:hypothetical protein DICVIV_12155 [Dictyocaulus viviparus]
MRLACNHLYANKLSKCHLNYCSQSIQQPFFMDVPYRDGCNVRRHRSQPPITITYEVTVVVQRHPLFITAGDRAYRLKCVYRQIDNGFLTQKLNINDLPSRSLEGVSKPLCRYDVMTSMNGPILQIVNVGEPLIFWLLRHLRQKKLFQFADQIMVHFVCQLTFCRAVDQGCEGITFERTYADNNSTSRGQSASSNVFKEVKIPDHSATYKSSIGIQDVYGLEITRFDEHRKRSQDYRTETISSVFDLSPNRAVEPMPSPFPANIYYAKPRFTRSDKHPPIENITVEVEAKKMLVFSSDDNERINTSSNCRHNIVDDSLCNRIIIGQAVLLAAAVLLQVTSIVVIITQRRNP